MTRLIAINYGCRHWLAWIALLVPFASAAFASIPHERNTANVFRVARLAFTKLMSSTNVVFNSHVYTNNAANQRTRQTRTDGSYVHYTYDNLGQLRTAAGQEPGVKVSKGVSS